MCGAQSRRMSGCRPAQFCKAGASVNQHKSRYTTSPPAYLLSLSNCDAFSTTGRTAQRRKTSHARAISMSDLSLKATAGSSIKVEEGEAGGGGEWWVDAGEAEKWRGRKLALEARAATARRIQSTSGARDCLWFRRR
jgi:hypothetical protein